jgi:hypothetical protein
MFACYPARLALPSVAFCLLAALIGCGKPRQVVKDRATVSGAVTFNGRPLPAGTISFQSTTGPVVAATAIQEGGAYITDRAPIGKNTVTVDTTSVQFGNAAAYVPIPAKYSDPTKSGFTAEINAGENENVNFALQGDAPKGR